MSFDYNHLIEEIALPDDSKNQVLKIISVMQNSAGFCKLTTDYLEGCNPDEEVRKLADCIGEDADIVALAFCVFCTSRTYQLYIDRDIPKEYFVPSVYDITVWNRQCIKDYGHNGIHGHFDWLRNTLNADLLRIGRLQFMKGQFNGEDYSLNGRTVKYGDPAYEIHIPEGERLDTEKCIASVNEAKRYFNNDVFTCHSWLLYPKHREFLNRNCNIVKFMALFDIVSDGEANDPGEIWRIFGIKDSYNSAELERNTSLQRAYAEWYGRTGKTGWGYGIYNK